MLPNSPERAITIAGIPQSIIECVKQVCVVMLETLSQSSSPPHPQGRDHPVLAQALEFSSHLCRWSGLYHSRTVCHSTARFDQAVPVGNATVSFSHDHGNTGLSGIGSSSPEVKGYWAGLAASVQTTSHELTFPNDMIGCIIGRQGAKINEIRQMSGAQIKTANPMEGSTDWQVTIF
ncbi:Poly(rC)-binding protein 2 [Cricetulus griseus]|uniref:Poly(RC)-binding protein 2 n=1 Tax=Cricetulus griseus TaxID=10029 RepID=G3IHV7_CRIGR|nr:Poly(rC)-binding protein 2 [Cricetulus griseus]